MFLVLGTIAIVATVLNLYLYKVGKDYKLAMAMGLSSQHWRLLQGTAWYPVG